MATKQSNAVDLSEEQEDRNDPRYEALNSTALLKLIPGIKAEGNDYYAGLPHWQQKQDLLGHPAVEEKTRLYYLHWYAHESNTELTAHLLFRADTLDKNSTQMLGVQALRYVEKTKSWKADGKPILAVVSEPNGKLDTKSWREAGGISMFRFEMSHPAQAGYRRSEAGIIAASGKELNLVLNYLSGLEPTDGSCSVGNSTPCRKVLNQFTSNSDDGDASTAGWPPVTLESNEINQHDNQTRKFTLKYEPKQGVFLLDDGRSPQDINALSIKHGEAFLTSLTNQGSGNASQMASAPVADIAAESPKN